MKFCEGVAPRNGKYLNPLYCVDVKAVLRPEMFENKAGLESTSKKPEVRIWPMLVAPGGDVVLDSAQNVVDVGGDPPYVLQIKHAPEALPTSYSRGTLELR